MHPNVTGYSKYSRLILFKIYPHTTRIPKIFISIHLKVAKKEEDVLGVMVGLVKVKMLVGYLVSKALRIRFGRNLYLQLMILGLGGDSI